MKYLLFFLICITAFGCRQDEPKFILLPSAKTKVTFNNRITESDSINVFDFANMYNGGGVGAGDFNNDGLEDLYFTGNMVPNQLYINKGNMVFQDITAASGTDGKGVWSRGVSVFDINNDGKLDIYVCATAKKNPQERINILYVNKGPDENGIPVFEDQAKEYGLADTSQSTMAYFFDYDNDKDLDLFIGVNHIIREEYTSLYRKINVNYEHPSTGRLYRNDWNDSLGHPFFTDVSVKAGILIEGYTHSANIADFNNDGWQDIFVANDYISNNVLYINNKDGTFTDRIRDYFKHTAQNAMGADAVDINNDGLEDIIELDMSPQDNYRKKMFLNPISYQNYLNNDLYGYQHQYVRNTLHLNQGHSIREMDTIGNPVFSDIGYFAGLAETDWSWTPLVADFDNDGNKDIIFTNGFPKDITDHDFSVYRLNASRVATKQQMLGQIPVIKIHNYIFRNSGNLTFSNYTRNWGLEQPSFSNGSVYVDLDNDGDLDLVMNNIDDEAMIYENKIEKGNYLQLKFSGSKNNINGVGAKAVIYSGGKMQALRNYPFRGYISSVSQKLHFGLGKDSIVDSLVITWPEGLIQTLKNVKVNQLLSLDIKNASLLNQETVPTLASQNWFTNITSKAGINYHHEQADFVDFNIQKLLPHKLSEYAPGIAAGDINGDQLDDFIVTGSIGHSATVFIQQPGLKFSSTALSKENLSLKKSDERGILLFDADNDGDLDAFISSGGNSYEPNNSAYADKLYINNGKGTFTVDTTALPLNYTSKFCVRAADFDNDGDLDIFVAGRAEPWAYPKPVSCFIYRNDSQKDKLLFTDVTTSIAPALQHIGLTSDAIFTDYDNDGWSDLILAGEWMPIIVLHNKRGKFTRLTDTGLEKNTGWWSSIAPGDFDNDGDIDYIAGNLGLNSFYRATIERPVSIRAKDFDNNGSYDAIPSIYLPSTIENDLEIKEFPAHGRDDMIKQMIGTRNKYRNYKSYANATIDSLLPAKEMEGAIKLSAGFLSSAYIENKGNGKFEMSALPIEAQFSMLNGAVIEDFDGDGNLDICFNSNDFGADPNVGRYDAMNGLVLKGDGAGKFHPLSIMQSGIFIHGDGKGLVKLKGADGSLLMAATMNKGPLQLYKLKKPTGNIIPVTKDETYAIVENTSGKKSRVEFNYGSSFLSQQGRLFQLNNTIKSVTFFNNKGSTRTVNANDFPSRVRK